MLQEILIKETCRNRDIYKKWNVKTHGLKFDGWIFDKGFWNSSKSMKFL